MNTTTRHHASEKSKVNGRWLSDFAQDTAQEVLSSSGKLAKRASAKAIIFGKNHPIQVALASVTVGFMLGAKLFGRRRMLE